MSLTVKKVAALRRRGQPGRYLDGGNTGVRGLYLIIQGRRAAHWEASDFNWAPGAKPMVLSSVAVGGWA